MGENSAEMPQLLHQHEMVSRSVYSKIGIPTILPLSSKAIISGVALSAGTNQLEKLSNFREQRNATPINPNNLRLSPWALYCLLNLNGSVEMDIEVANAIRFGHIEIGKNPPGTQLNQGTITNAFVEAFKSKFPWKKEGGIVDDKRIEGVDLINPVYIEVENGNVKTSAGTPTIHDSNKKRPTIIYIKPDTGKTTKTEIEDERKLVLEHSNNKPFVIVLKQYGDYTQVHFICNHEYMDGIPVAFYTNKIIDQLKLQTTSLADIEDGLLNRIFQDADYRECANPHGGYRVKTVSLGTEITKSAIDLYKGILTKNPHISLSFESFWQLFLMAQSVDGQTVKGGVLKFSPDITKQLDLYSIGNAKGVLQALLNGDTNKLNNEYVSYFVPKGDKKSFGLYRTKEALMAKTIAPLTRVVPQVMWKSLNDISKRTKGAEGISGQVMTSIVPSEIVVDHEKVQLGSGFGGPACTEYQRVATTSTVVRDSKGNVINIIVRRKYQKEDKMGTVLQSNKQYFF